MNTVVIHKLQDGVPYKNAPAGAICEIIEAEDNEMVGMLCIKPYQSNQCVTVINKLMASTDNTFGIKRVRPLQHGDSFTVVIDS